MVSKRSEATAKAQYEHELAALEGNWDEAPIPEVRQVYIESAKVGLAAADEVMFSEEAALRVAKTLFAHTLSDNAGTTAPEIIAQCESATQAVFDVLKTIGRE